jgi:hypothetical protein
MHFELQQGHTNPRSGDLQWSTFDTYETLEQALDAYKGPMGMGTDGIWRINQVITVWMNDEAESYS